MQIVYLGFAGSAKLEAAAATQLIRLERFGNALAGCHLAIEALAHAGDQRRYDVRLDLLMRSGELQPVEHQIDPNPQKAVQCAFASAERLLEKDTFSRTPRTEPRAGLHA